MTPASIRKLATGGDLPRLAPIEEIDATTDLTRFDRKVPFMSVPGRNEKRSPLAIVTNARDFWGNGERARLLVLFSVFVAGCAIGGVAILLAR